MENNSLHILYNKSMEFGQKMIDDLVEKTEGVVKYISEPYFNDSIVLKPTFYYENGTRYSSDNFDIKMSKELLNMYGKGIIKIDYYIILNIEFGDVDNIDRLLEMENKK